MSAIEQLQAWWKREERPPAVYLAMGDTIDSRAILELAERLRLLEGDVRELAGKVEQPVDPSSTEEAAPDLYFPDIKQIEFFLMQHDSGRRLGAEIIKCLLTDHATLLESVRPPPAEQPQHKRITGFMNLYASRYPSDGSLIQGSSLCATTEEADKLPGAARRIACVYVSVPAEDVKGSV